jgi:hypothetical protein
MQGVVQRISGKQINGTTLYSFTLSGQDGWIGTGSKKPPKEGTSIKFDVKINKRGYTEVDGGIEIITDGEPGPAPSTSEMGKASGAVTRANGSGGGSQGAYWDRKEARDIHNDAMRELGATRNTALTIIDLGLKYEVFKLPAAAKREEFLWNLIDKYTSKLMGKGAESDNGDSPVENSSKQEEPHLDSNWE